MAKNGIINERGVPSIRNARVLFRSENGTSKARLMYLEVKMQQLKNGCSILRI